LIFFAVILAPAAEEFIFRGILYPFIKQLGFPSEFMKLTQTEQCILYPFIKQLGYPKLSLIGVSLAFASIHGSLVVVLPLFVFALAQTWLYEKTDCLLAPMITHSVFNLANLVIMFASGTLSPPNGVHS
jgi:membrane protease YdiL (CAAX protease family)